MRDLPPKKSMSGCEYDTKTVKIERKSTLAELMGGLLGAVAIEFHQ
jgi:hypothetical protein